MTGRARFLREAEAEYRKRKRVPAPESTRTRLQGTVGEGEDAARWSDPDKGVAPFNSGFPSSAGIICHHGFADWTRCPGCTGAADFDDGSTFGDVA